MRGSRKSRARASLPYGARLGHALCRAASFAERCTRPGEGWNPISESLDAAPRGDGCGSSRFECEDGMKNAGTNTVLVTGGAGYIGSHTCKILAQEGYLPVAFDNLSSGHAWAAKWGPLERGDILDRAALDRVIEKYRPSACLHFAAFAYVGESVSDPGKYYRNNVVGSLTLLEALRDHGVDQFVLSSTCATYGVPDRVPIDETLPQAPINPYGASKLMVERMLADFHAAHRLRSVALRYFNAAGADPDVRDRRGSRSRDTPGAAGSRCRMRRPRGHHGLRNRLRDARWDMRSRLYPRDRLGKGPCPGIEGVWSRASRTGRST